MGEQAGWGVGGVVVNARALKRTRGSAHCSSYRYHQFAMAAQPTPSMEYDDMSNPDHPMALAANEFKAPQEPSADEVDEVDPFADLDVILFFHGQPADEQMAEFVARLNQLAGFLDVQFSFVRRFNRIHVCVSTPLQFSRAKELVIVNLDRLNAMRPEGARVMGASDVIAQPGKRVFGPREYREGTQF